MAKLQRGGKPLSLVYLCVILKLLLFCLLMPFAFKYCLVFVEKHAQNISASLPAEIDLRLCLLLYYTGYPMRGKVCLSSAVSGALSMLQDKEETPLVLLTISCCFCPPVGAVPKRVLRGHPHGNLQQDANIQDQVLVLRGRNLLHHRQHSL